jgi:ribosomal protein S9
MRSNSQVRIFRGNTYLTIRKSSIALVKVVPGVGSIHVNNKLFADYFQNNPS